MRLWTRTIVGWLTVAGSALASAVAIAQGGGERPTEERSAVHLINDGDSLLDVIGSPGRVTSLTLAVPMLPGHVRVDNVAVSGRTLAQLAGGFAETVGRRYDRNARLFIVHILAGGNDLRRGATGAEIYALLQSYVRSVHALGPNAVAVVATYPLQCDIFRNSALNAALQAYNNSIYRGWDKPQRSGGLEADALADYFADPEIGPGSYSSSAFCDREWSNDGQHLNDRGKAIMGRVEAQAVSRLLAGR